MGETPVGPGVQAAATCGNFGPGFDVFSLALDVPGDRARLASADADVVQVTGPAAEGIPDAWKENCAAVAVDHLRERFGVTEPLCIELEKNLPPGSGLGSSASSSAAGALAFAERYGKTHTITPEDLLEAAAAGERAVSGDHRDDVAAALFGGLVAVTPGSNQVLRLRPPPDMRLAFVRPHVQLETKRMRAAVPTQIPRGDAVANLAAVARMVDAVHRGDLPAVGAALTDRIATPYRVQYIPYFEEARQAALETGAHGFALAGSGPSMFGLCERDDAAHEVLRALLEVYGHYHMPADGFVTRPREEVTALAPPLH